MSGFKQNWFVVPNRIMQLEGLTLQLLRFYETIFQFWNNGENCYLTNGALMVRSGMKSKSSVDEAFLFFERHGELSRTTRNGKRYLEQPQKLLEIQADEKSSTHSPQRAAPTRHSECPPLATARHNNNNLKSNNLNKSFCDLKAKKAQNEVKHEFAQSMNQMASEQRHIDKHEQIKKTAMPQEIRDKLRLPIKIMKMQT
jgi:hypothetical protein